MYLIINLI